MEDEGLYYNKCWITILGAFVSVGASVDSFFVSFVSSVSVICIKCTKSIVWSYWWLSACHLSDLTAENMRILL